MQAKRVFMAKLPPAGVVNFMNKVRYGLGRLQQKLVPAPIADLDFVTGMWNFQIVYALCELGVFEKLGNAPLSVATLSSQLGLPEDRLYRVLRAASVIGVVSEAQGRAFTLTAMGSGLREDTLGSMRDYILFQGRYGWKSWSQLTEVMKGDKNALQLLYGQSTFEFFSTPKVSETFNKAMTAISAMAVDGVLAAYDFKPYKRIADVGGGHGRLLGTILRDYPHLEGVLVDLPAVVVGAEPVLDELGVKSRCRIEAGDFFEPLPALNADLILMKNIIHDWSDDDAKCILNHCREQMKPDAKLLLCEVVVPLPNQPSFAKHLDIEMLVHAEGKERTQEEYAALFKDAGLKMNRVIATPGPMSLIEADLAHS